MTEEEIDNYFSMKEFFDRYEHLDRKYNQWISQETKKSQEGMTVWNYYTRTGKFENW